MLHNYIFIFIGKYRDIKDKISINLIVQFEIWFKPRML